MRNPWLKLDFKKDPYILEDDEKIVNGFNERRTNEDYIIRLDNLPTPYAGDFNKAKILLLQLNPGSEILPGLEPTENHEFLVYRDLKHDLIKSLRHENMDFPFYWLNPKYILTGGFKYWTRIFSTVIKNKDDYKQISNNICCVQYFPYHSKKYQHINKIVESQNYGFDLVRNFIKKPNKLIILMRAEKEWLNNKAVPELRVCKYAILKSKINPVLSKNNFVKEEDYKCFLEYLGVSNINK